jgi:hypothetical protein
MLGIYSDPQLRDAAAALHALPREALLMSKLSVFISSSGDRSRQLAEFLCKWLRGVLRGNGLRKSTAQALESENLRSSG